jgi:cation diffusion facilitator CzcD-associated flavoprotein CzcO
MTKPTEMIRTWRGDLDRWRKRRDARRRPAARPTTAAPSVVIIGAGMSGMCAAIRLREAGITDITILERSDGVGGTWRDNHYPGSACDVPSHFYSFSFAPNPNWTRKFPPQAEILAYFEDVARKYQLLPLCRFGVEVERAAWNDTTSQWEVNLADGEVIRGDVLIPATGQLNRPFIPEIPGLDTFAGEQFHSARWNHDHSFADETVAIIGTGASAIQFGPEVAKAAGHTLIFQRSPHWIMPKPDRAYRPWERRLFRVPLLNRLYRMWIWMWFEKNYALIKRKNAVRDLLQKSLAKGYSDKLVAKGLPRDVVIPDYPLGCKRILITNDWFPMMLRDDVDVVTSHIASIAPREITTVDGTVHHVDSIVFGTGFQTTKFLTPIKVFGRGGQPLSEIWKSGAFAHLGMAVPGFPNCFILYGPNTNLGHNSIIFMTERQVDYVVRCVVELWRTGGVMEIRPDVLERFEADIETAAADTVWLASCDNWYKTEQGRLVNNWPGRTTDYWRATVDGGPQDFSFVATPR